MHTLNRSLVWCFTLVLLVLLPLSGAIAAEKVTGEFIRAPNPNPNTLPIQITEVAAHEATEIRAQKGYYFTHTDRDNDGIYDSWRLIDLNDSENSCVNIYGDGLARVGGLVSDWNEGNTLGGRFLGYDMLDGGQPNSDEPVDFLTIILFIVPDPDNIDALLLGFKHWCETGELEEDIYLGAFPKYVMEGNLKIHNEE